MSLTCYDEIRRVGRVPEDVTRMSRGCYEETPPVEFRLSNYRTITPAQCCASNRIIVFRQTTEIVNTDSPPHTVCHTAPQHGDRIVTIDYCDVTAPKNKLNIQT